MNKNIFLHVCVLAVALCSCASRASTPEAVATQFLDCFFMSDFDGAAAYAGDEMIPFLDESAAMFDGLDSLERSEVVENLKLLTIAVMPLEEKPEGNQVSVTYTATFSETGDIDQAGVLLRKEGRKWVVCALE